MKTFYRWKILISDFFNKIPAIILVPGVLLAAFLAAALLILMGIRMSPVSLKESPDPFESKKNNDNKAQVINSPSEDYSRSNEYFSANSESQSRSRSGYGDNDYGLDLPDEAPAKKPSQSQGSTDLSNQNENSKETGLPASATSNKSSNDINAEETATVKQETNSGSSGSNGIKADSEATSTSYSSSSGLNQEESSSGCSYPEGDVNIWWRKATAKQKDCYIKQHGQPNFNRDTPYFCDYDSNEDCYYK